MCWYTDISIGRKNGLRVNVYHYIFLNIYEKERNSHHSHLSYSCELILILISFPKSCFGCPCCTTEMAHCQKKTVLVM